MSTHVLDGPAGGTGFAPPRAARDGAESSLPATVQWRSPARNLWFGESPGRSYAGMIERIGAEYLATDDMGAPVGAFPSLGDAESALVAVVRGRGLHARPFPRLAAVIAAASGAVAVGTAVLGLIVLSH